MLPGAAPMGLWWRRSWMVACALAAGLLVACTTLDERLSQPLRDAQLRWLAPTTDPGGVLVVDIDDASLATLQPLFGPWPWGRDVHALVIERLRELGASAVALDVLLVDERPGDVALAKALARPGAPVVLAAAGVEQSSADAQQLATLAATVRLPPRRAPISSGSATRHLVVPASSLWPAPDRLPAVGVITTPTDRDGHLRRMPLATTVSGNVWPLMPLAVLEASGGRPGRPPVADADGRVHFAFPGERGGPPVLPIAALMVVQAQGPAATVLRETVQGKVVFVGQSAQMADAVLTVQGQLSGTRVLASAYAALRDGSTVHPEPRWLAAALFILALLPVSWAVTRAKVRPRHAMLATALISLVLVGIAVAAHLQARMPLDWAAPGVVLATGLAAMLYARHREQVADEWRLQQALEVERRTGQAKREFLAQVSHELRTPMNALLGVADLLEDTSLTATQRRHVDVFRRSGQSLLELINDLLEVSRIEAGRVDIRPEAFVLADLVEHVHALLGRRAELQGLSWRIEQTADLPIAVLGDRRRIEQALINLAGNAIKFTPRGEVVLAVERAAAGRLRFQVRDTGIGIPEDRVQAIFEPFEQADSGISLRYGGSGLGLTITKRLVQAMGGSIAVDSQPGRGSRFTIELPLPDTEEPERAPAAPAPSPMSWLGAATAPAPQLGGRVLLAEDNEVNVYLFRAMLDGMNLDIEVARDGFEALTRLRTQAFDIAFLDVQMPGRDGLAVTREWRLEEEASRSLRLPIVALTAQAMPEDIQASLDAGCDRHLSKPVSRTQLIDTVRALVKAPERPESAVAPVATPAPPGSA